MKLNEMQLYSALNEFIDKELMPLGASMDLKEQFVFGFKMGIIKRKAQTLVKSYLNKQEIKMLDLIDENRQIDVETMYQSAMDMFSQVKELEIAGITFKEQDLSRLYSIMQKYA
jgi:GTPase involved in cell partitioning and DNA repair